jgi:hypothetical protein
MRLDRVETDSLDFLFVAIRLPCDLNKHVINMYEKGLCSKVESEVFICTRDVIK